MTSIAKPQDDEDPLYYSRRDTLIGITVILLTVFEGFWFLDRAGEGITGGVFVGLGSHNPFTRVLRTGLVFAAFGDIVCGVIGAVGAYCCFHPSPYFLDYFDNDHHSHRCKRMVMILFTWRAFVLVAAAPWCGTSLGFADSGFNKADVIVWIILYFVGSLHLLWGLLYFYKFASAASVVVQERHDIENEIWQNEVKENARLLASEPVHAGPQSAFGCLPLELSVFLYLFLSCVISIRALVVQRYENVANGWAYPLNIPGLPSLWNFANVVFGFSAIITYIGAMAMIYHRYARNALDAFELPESSFSEEADRFQKIMKRATATILATSVLIMTRITFFVPLTGTALLTTDFCGFYIRGLWAISAGRSDVGAALPLHCSAADWIHLIGIVFVASLDIYLSWGVFRVWRKYRCTFSSPWVGLADTASKLLQSGYGSSQLPPSMASNGSIVKSAVL